MSRIDQRYEVHTLILHRWLWVRRCGRFRERVYDRVKTAELHVKVDGCYVILWTQDEEIRTGLPVDAETNLRYFTVSPLTVLKRGYGKKFVKHWLAAGMLQYHDLVALSESA